jgi:GTP:adenosylcobinamide-phosphate guanylyltransferase
MDRINVLIMAGDSGKREYDNQITNKSLMDVSDKWMVEYVVDALRESGMIDKIAIVGPAETLKSRLADRVDYFIREEAHLFENLKKGLSLFKDEEFVLVASSDIPMITGSITPRIGISNFSFTMSRLMELTVLHAITIIFIPWLRRNLIHCSEYLITVSFERVP